MSISSRITEIEQHITNAYDGLEDIGADLTNIDKNINNISTVLENVWNEYPKVTATDVEEATLNGTKKGRMEIDLKGNTKQEQLTGKNLYDKDNANILNTPIDANGLGTNAPNTYRSVWIPCEANTTYTISKLYDSTKNRFTVAYTTQTPDYGVQTYGNTSNNAGSNITITTGADAQYLVAYVWIAGGSTTPTEIIDSIQIEKGSTATSYEPYCGGIPSPNPSYPQQIKNVTGQANVKIQNKNLFDVTKITNKYPVTLSADTTNNILEITANITTGAQYITYRVDNFDIAENYTLSFKAKKVVKGTSGNSNLRCSIAGSNDGIDYTHIAHIDQANPTQGTEYSLSYTVTGYSTYRLRFYNDLSTPVTEGEKTQYYDIQIEQGTIATSYVAHQEQNFPFTFKSKNLFDYDTFIANNRSYTFNVIPGNILYRNAQLGSLANWKVYNNNNELIEDLAGKFPATGSYTIPANAKYITTTDTGISSKLYIGYSSDTSFEPYYDIRAMQGTTLEDDGIHNNRKRLILTGTEDWRIFSLDNNKFQFYRPINDLNHFVGEKTVLSNYFKADILSNRFNGNNQVYSYSEGIAFATTIATTIEDWKTWLATQYNNNTPVIAEYELTETEIIPYNSTQQAQYNAIEQAKSYDDQTNISSTSDELGFNMDVESLRKKDN